MARQSPLPPWPHAAFYGLSPRSAGWAGISAGIVGALAIAGVIVSWGPIPAGAVLLALVAAVLVAVDVRAGLWVVLTIVALLPYAVVPVKVVVTPPLLELAGLAVLAVWIARSLLDRTQTIPFHPVVLATLFFAFVTLFAFVLGLDRGYTSQTYHDYAKFLVSLALFFVAWSSLRSAVDVRWLTVVFVALSACAAAVGLALYVGGPGVTLAVLARLIPIGYPATRIVRYIEDDPAKPMRLIGTSVDPNSFAGLLALGLVLAVTHAVARRPAVPRWLALGAAALIAPALLLTYSRAGWLGAAFGLGIVALARYRWLFVPGALGIAGALVLGVGRVMLERLWQGFTLQDPATQMRLEEYRTALAILREYPAFGVGFGQAPTIELWTGVSSIYLLVAERMGLIGLTAFLLAVFGAVWVGWRAWLRGGWSADEGDLLLGWLGAQSAALLIGLFDHYYVNISFPHMVAVFWLVHANVLRLAVIVQGERERA